MITKKDIIFIADCIKRNRIPNMDDAVKIEAIATALSGCNPRFNKDRFLGYINGTCGPNGGPVRP